MGRRRRLYTAALTGLAGLLSGLGFGGRTAAAQPPAPRAIVLVTVDTLRADAVSFAGYEHETTPYLSSLAGEGVVLRRAYAPSSWTSPSMASLFTGLYPTSHGVTAGFFTNDLEVLRQPVLPESLTTLAEAFGAAGYETVGVPSNRHLSKDLGFAQGFDHYLERAYFLSASQVVSKTREMLLRAFGRDWKTTWKERPVFLWIHFFDPHAPYAAQKPWIGEFAPRFLKAPGDFPAGFEWKDLMLRYPEAGATAREELRPLYDSEVAYVDEQLKELAGDLGLEDPDVLFILTSDHGEEFSDHGELGHGHTLYEEVVRVPLLVHWPAGLAKGLETDQPVGLQDLYPTLLELAGIDVKENGQSRSFAEILRGGRRQAPRPYYFELSSRDSGDSSIIGMIEGEWKVIRSRGTGPKKELFHLARDPGELRNLAATERDRTRRLELALRDWLEGLEPPESVEQLPLDDELRKELEALGYVGTAEGR